MEDERQARVPRLRTRAQKSPNDSSARFWLLNMAKSGSKNVSVLASLTRPSANRAPRSGVLLVFQTKNTMFRNQVRARPDSSTSDENHHSETRAPICLSVCLELDFAVDRIEIRPRLPISSVPDSPRLFVRSSHSRLSFPIAPRQYDTDVVTWSPQGRIFQVEYAMEAVKQARTRTTTRRLPHSPLSLSHSRCASMACVFTAGIGRRRPEILLLRGDRDVKTCPLGAELVPEKDLQDRRSPRHCDIWVDGRRAYSLPVHAERVLESSVCVRECHAGGQVGAAGCG